MTRTRLLLGAWLTLTSILCVGDYLFHVRTGVLYYHWPPLVGGQSVWVWPIFAVASALMLALSLAFKRLDVPASAPWVAIVGSAAAFVVTYWITGLFGQTHPTELFGGLVVAWVVRVAIRRANRTTFLMHGLVLAAGGVLGEGLFSKAGLFDFRLQQVFDCPWWLVGFYLHASIALLEVVRGARSLGRQQLG